MSLKKEYYKLSKEEFNDYLSNIKKNKDTIFLFSNDKERYFFYPNLELLESTLVLNMKQWEFDGIMKSFSSIGKSLMFQSFLLEEIKSTNDIENIYSTHHDIFLTMKSLSNKHHNKDIDSIINGYQMIMNNQKIELTSLKDIKNVYDKLIGNSLEEKNIPDGEYFRKGEVFISDGLKSVHSGFYPEEMINQGMNDFLKVYNGKLETYLKAIVTHFMIETIHPFYDGNGRFGRFLFSSLIYQNTKSYFAFLVSSCINRKKNKYYSAFKEGRDIHEFGCINEYVDIIINILTKGCEDAIKSLNEKKEEIKNLKLNGSFTKSEQRVLSLLKEGTILSYFGLSQEEIMDEAKISKRTLIYTLNKFLDKGILEVTKLGHFNYYKIKR